MPPRISLPQKPKIEKIAFDEHIFEIFQKLEGHFDDCFLLESLTEGQTSRYTILGFAPESVISGNGRTLTVDGKEYAVENPYHALRAICPQHVLTRGFVGGLVGSMSYEAAEFFESALTLHKHKDFDQFRFGLYTDGLVYDKTTGETLYFYYRKNRLSEMVRLLKTGSTRKVQATSVHFRGFSLSKAEHRKIVEKVKEKIRGGYTFQCEVGFRANFTLEGSALPIYKELRRVNPSPYLYYLKFGKQTVFGASPELLFQLRDGEMESYPLAGTVSRGKTEAEDQRLAKQLVNDPKERAEHAMLVDLHRNDLGRAARFGTVRVRQLMEVKKFSHVQHLSSEITALLAPEHDMFTALAYSFPAGTLSGAPKIESMKIIDANEKTGRGPYGGAVGFFGFNGNCMFAIPIRSLYVSGTDMYTQTSGGIVHDSTPENE
ncbi:MAG: anthranilate synthase component I family protein [Patescibacteria group bacterium]